MPLTHILSSVYFIFFLSKSDEQLAILNDKEGK